MITIIADPHSYKPLDPGSLSVRGPEDYVAARIALRRALDEGLALTVHVTAALPLHWLADMEGYEGVRWERIAPEADFRRLFGDEPRPPFSTDLLVDLDLTTIPEPPIGMLVEPAAWILGQRVDPVWLYQQGGATHLEQLLGWCLRQGDTLPANLHPLVQQRLSSWAAEQPLYGSLRAGSLSADARAIVRRWALQRYDALWLDEHGLAALPLFPGTVGAELCIDALTGFAPQIERYWRRRAAEQGMDVRFLQRAIDQMSGCSDAELRVVGQLARSRPELLDQRTMRELRRRFGNLPTSANTLGELEALVPPAEPELPEGDWPDQQWLRWATNEYLPYFLWTVRTGRDRERQQQHARACEEWLAKRYPEWLYSAQSPLHLRQFTLAQDLIRSSSRALVVWLVADGMTWWQGRMFWELCRDRGLFAQRYETGIALLPSLTSISKRALVTGITGTSEPRGSIAEAAREQLSRFGVRHWVGYESRALMAELHAEEPPRCLIWFANTLDRLAHDRTDVADDGLVRGYLEQLANDLVTMQRICAERGFVFHALVGSDHGSTLLPVNAPLRRLPQATREVIDVWEDNGDRRAASPVSARAALVAGDQSLTPDQLEEWFFLERRAYQLPHDYLVPRGYAAVGRRPTGWTHGGLTPEETVVPLLHLAPEPLVIEPVTVILSGQVRSQQAGVIDLVLINVNPAPLDDVEMLISDLAPVRINQIPASDRVEMKLSLGPRQIVGGELTLAWELEGRLLGIAHRQQGEARLSVRRLQTEDRFDDLFG
jgi:hypothetical protein